MNLPASTTDNLPPEAPEAEGVTVDDAEGVPPEAYAAALAGLPGMGPSRLAAVLDVMSPACAWARVRQGAPWREPAVAAALGPKGSQVVDGWRAAAAHTQVDLVWRQIVEASIGVALRGRPGYPPVLVDDIEPPALVFHRGAPEVLAGRARVALVGTRRCTPTGSAVAFELGRDLAAEGVSVVSGLASGIDGAAHRGAIAAGAAPPIGVVGSGLDVVYPPHQHQLWHAVADKGVVLSEAPLGARPERWRFPARNRIIAALADIVVVVESHLSGGSMHTVDEADRRSVDVMVVPGSVRNTAAAGTNALLAEGRAPVRDVGDVLVALGLSAATQRDARESRPPPSEGDAAVLDAVGWQPSTFDQTALRTGLDLPTLAQAFERLLNAGWIVQHGTWYERIAPGDHRRSLP